MYVVGELDSTLLTYERADEGRSLSPVSRVSTRMSGGAGESSGAGIAVSPDGSTVYVSNRGDDSIAVFGLDDDGMPALQEVRPCSGAFPRFIHVAADGSAGGSGAALLVAHERADTVTAFPLDEAGRLGAERHLADTGSPVCVSQLAVS